MSGEPPQDKHRSDPPQADKASRMQEIDSTISGSRPSATEGRETMGEVEGALPATTRDGDQNLEQAQDDTQTHANASPESSGEAPAKESMQSLRLTLPEGGNPAKHLTPEQLLEVDNSERRAREFPIQSQTAPREPVRSDTVLLAPEDPPIPPIDSTPDDNAKAVEQSPFQTASPESSDVRSVSDVEMPEVPLSTTNNSAESEITSESDPGGPTSETSAQQQLPGHEDRPASARAQFDGIAKLSDPNSSPSGAAASTGGSAASAPFKSADSATVQPAPAEEKAAPLPRIIVMVGLDDAEKIVHEEMRVFSRELALVGRQIAKEETENLMFDFRAQINALLG